MIGRHFDDTDLLISRVSLSICKYMPICRFINIYIYRKREIYMLYPSLSYVLTYLSHIESLSLSRSLLHFLFSRHFVTILSFSFHEQVHLYLYFPFSYLSLFFFHTHSPLAPSIFSAGTSSHSIPFLTLYIFLS